MASGTFPGHAVFLLLIFVSTSTIGPAQSQLVNSVCREVDGYIAGYVQALCSDPLTCRATDLTNLTINCFDLATSNATKAVEIVMQVDKDPRISPALKDQLDFCVSGFQQAVESFRGAYEHVKSRDGVDPIGMAGYYTMFAYQEVDICTKNLATYNLTVPEISKLGDNIYLFARIGMLLTDRLQESAVTKPVTADKAH